MKKIRKSVSIIVSVGAACGAFLMARLIWHPLDKVLTWLLCVMFVLYGIKCLCDVVREILSAISPDFDAMDRGDDYK